MHDIPYGHQSINQQDIEAVVKTLQSNFLTQGPAITQFEEELCLYTGAKYAVALSSGTAALHAAYFAVGLQAGDEFITPPLTFAATANAGLYLGAEPIFVDVEADSGNLNPSLVEEKITSKTKLLVVVDYAGNPANLEQLSKLAKKHHLFLVEDACHALGATYQHHRIGDGNFTDASVLSFHPVKHITTGEGGAVLTNNHEIYQKALMFRTHGITKDKTLLKDKRQGDWYYEMQSLGYNYRMTDIQAALGISQLKRFPLLFKKRKMISDLYNQEFHNSPYFDILPTETDRSNAYHLYPVFLKEKYKSLRHELFQQLHKHQMKVQVHYIPVYWHPFYQQLGYKKGLCPVSESLYEREISLPIYSDLKRTQVRYVIEQLNKIIYELIQAN